MKKYTFIAVAFAALAAVSCVKDNMGGAESKTYQASFTDKLLDAKATIAVGQQESLVSWEVSDRVGIMYGASNLEYKADQAGSYSTLSAVSASADASEVWALLPYDPSATLSAGVINTILPSEQPAKADASFHHLAVAHSTSASLAFSNVCGLVRVKVTTEGITKVVFAGKADEKVAGNIAITVADCSVSGADAESVALVPAEGETSIAEGDYFLAVLPQTFQNGFTVTAYKGETAVQTKDIAGPVTLKRCGVFAGTIREVTISAISTNIATVGETVKITGTGFSEVAADNTVSIGNIACTVTAASATELSVTVPAGLSKSTDYKFAVTVRGANAVESPAFRYYYVPAYTSTSRSLGYKPEGLALTTDGYLWVTDRNSSPHKLVKYKLSDFSSTTTVNANNYPFGCDVNSKNEIYVAAKNAKAVGYIDSEGKWAYTQYADYLNNPMDLVFDSSDNMYVASRDNHSIVQFKNNEYVKSFANTHRANALTLDVTEENIFYGVGATGSSSNDWKFYKLNLATGNITVIAGSGTKPAAGVYSNGSAGNTLTAVIGNITGLVCTSDGYVYFVDSTHALRVLVPGVGGDHTKGLIKVVAGIMGTAGNVQIGDSSAPLGKLHTPDGMEIDSNGVIYIAENGNSAIRVLTPVN
jgi:sugar lactone lactonase YvrE